MIHLHLLTRASLLLSLINWHHCDLGIELCSIPARTLGTKMLSVEIFRMSRYNQQCHENHGLSVFVCTSYSCFVSVSDDDLSFIGAYSLMARDDARGLCKRPRHQSAGNINLYSQAITTTTCHLAMLLAVLTIPLVILGHVTLTPQQNAKCLRSEGHT